MALTSACEAADHFAMGGRNPAVGGPVRVPEGRQVPGSPPPVSPRFPPSWRPVAPVRPLPPPLRPASIADHFRPDVEGLRGVAILLVVAFHAAPEVLGGGFIGVDVFFVISGFLITGLLYRELQ